MSEDKAPTLDEVLSARFDELQAPEKEEVVTVGSKEPDIKPVKARAEDGKFAKSEKKEEKPEIKEDGAKDATPKEITVDKAKEGEGETLISQPPASWSAAAKAKWSLLDPEVRAEAHRLEKETQKVLALRANDKKQYEGLEQILSPRRGKLAAMYGSEARAIEQLFALSDFAEKDPQGFLQYFAQQRGLNLASLGGAKPQIDPQTAALLQKVQALEGKIQKSEETQQQAVMSEVERLYQTFASDPKNVYFNDVKDDMADLLQAGLAKDFADAYDQAVWRNPSTREKLRLEQTTAEAAKRQKEAEEKAIEAKRVNATNVATKGVHGSSPDKPLTLDESLNRTWNRLHSAA